MLACLQHHSVVEREMRDPPISPIHKWVSLLICCSIVYWLHQSANRGRRPIRVSDPFMEDDSCPSSHHQSQRCDREDYV